jgi:hypothetical protein
MVVVDEDASSLEDLTGIGISTLAESLLAERDRLLVYWIR